MGPRRRTRRRSGVAIGVLLAAVAAGPVVRAQAQATGDASPTADAPVLADGDDEAALPLAVEDELAPVHAEEPEAREPEGVLPDESRSILVPGAAHAYPGLQWIGRVLLAGPRLALMVATEPLYQLSRLEDEYRITARAEDFFFNDARTFGVYPTAFIETGFGLNAGARLVHRDLFGDGEGLKLRAGLGTRLLYTFGASLDSGRRLGDDFRLGLELEADRRSDASFFGIGDTGVDPRDEVELPQHAVYDRRIAPARVRRKIMSGTLFATLHPERQTSLVLVERFRARFLRESAGQSSSTKPALGVAFDLDSIPGYADRYLDVLTEARLRVGRTDTASFVLPASLPSSGYRMDVRAGYQVGIDDPYRFARTAVDLQGFADLWGGERVLRFRARVESVLGERDRIPFLDLPTLGGPLYLRGYPRGRFRGTTTLLGTVEYRYPVQPNLAAYLFVDVGRAFDELAVDEVRHLRAGYGGGLLLFARSAFLLGLQVASSIDGGVEVHFRLSTNDSTEDE